jgi:hypothetical protein
MKNPPRVAGLISLIAAAVLLVAGIGTWAMISTNLVAQNITVAKDSPMLPGDLVDGPFSAFAEAQIIEHHALTSTEGKTYADLGAEQTKVKTAAKAAGIDLDSKDPAVIAANQANPQYTQFKADLDKWTAQRTQAMNASFLRASLFTSVVAYGVAALVIGLGVMFGLVGWALLWLGGRVDPAAVRVDRTPGSGSAG